MEYIQAYSIYIVVALFLLMLFLIGKEKNQFKQIQIFAWMGMMQLFILSLLGYALLQKGYCYNYYEKSNITIPKGGEVLLYKNMKYCVIKTKDGKRIKEVKVNDARTFIYKK